MLSCYPGSRPVAEALYGLMADLDAEGLGLRVPFERRKAVDLGFQYVGVEMLVREYGIARGPYQGARLFECEGRRILGGRGEEAASHYVSRRGGLASHRDLAAKLPPEPFPLVLIDLSLISIHTEEELSSLRVQIAMSLSETRRYLWDRHLALASAPEGIDEWLRPLVGRNKMIIARERAGELLWRLRADRVYILRPDAEEPLRPSEVMGAQAFVIGGIVDKIPRPGLSRVLDSSVPWGEPRRLEVRGSIVGVPERIHRIVGAILRARLDLYGLIDRALVEYMARQDRVMRLFHELQRRGAKRICLRGSLEEYKWLMVDERDVLLAAKRAHVEVDDSC